MVIVRVRSLGIIGITIVEAAAVPGAVAGRVLLVVVMMVILLVITGTPICTTTSTPVVRILVLALVLVLSGILGSVRVTLAVAALALMAPCYHVSHVDAAPGEARQVAVIVIE